jgi:hypothetical protein
MRGKSGETVEARMPHAQTRLKSVLVTPIWVNFRKAPQGFSIKP